MTQQGSCTEGQNTTSSFWDSLPPRVPRADDTIRLQLTAMREVVKSLKKDIVSELEYIMRRELDASFEKVKQWAKELSVAGVIDDPARSVAREAKANSTHFHNRPVMGLSQHAQDNPPSRFRAASEDELSHEMQATPRPGTQGALGFLPDGSAAMEHLQDTQAKLIANMSHLEVDVGFEDASWEPDISPRSRITRVSTKSEKSVKSAASRRGIIVSLSCEESNSSLVQSEIIEAVVNGPIETVQSLLEQKMDPNLVFENIKINGKKFTHCSLVAAAVLAHRPTHVELLVKMNADIESKYGFIAGVNQNMAWSGPASHATIPKSNVQMLKLLLDLMCDPGIEASNGANMVWQCAYFGRSEMLQLLLSTDLHIENFSNHAEYQNHVGITYSPLHISVVMGQEQCSRLLLGANVPVDARNERNESPLDTAIRLCRPELVTLLIQAGAEVVPAQGNFAGTTGFITSALSTGARRAATIDDLAAEENDAQGGTPVEMLLSKPNPVLVHAMALGLQAQPKQVERMTVTQILDVCQTDTASMVAMLQALFVARQIRYKAKDVSKGVRERKTALLRDAEKLPGTDNEHNFPIVISTTYAYSDLQSLERSGKRPEKDLKDFIQALTPQKHIDRHPCMHMIYAEWKRHHVPITVHECLVPTFHQDLRFLKAIADADPLNNLFLNPHCQAIITYAWSRAKKLAALHCFVHLMMLLFYAYVAVHRSYQYRDGEHYREPTTHADASQYVSYVAIGISPFWLFEVLAEFLEFLVHIEYGWTRDYLTDIKKYLDVCRVFSDGIVILAFILSGLTATDKLYFRCFMGIVCVFKWTKMLYCLTPFRRFGLPVLPIIYTLSNVGSSVAIMVVYYSGMAHGVVALDLLPSTFSFTVLRAFFFGIGGDAARVEQFDNPHDREDFESWFLQFLLMVALFAAPVTFMNIFIAAMSSSYEYGITHTEELYMHRCVDGTFSHACVQHALRKRLVSSSSEKPARLWYSRVRIE